MSAVAPPPAAGGGPPPPPPPAIQPPSDVSSSGGGGGQAGQRANLFASINKGGDITKGSYMSDNMSQLSLTLHCLCVGLRKVTDGMKTHKNPELRASSVVKASDKPAAKAPPKAAVVAAIKKSPVCALQGKKWVVVSW